jgi:hypothetical protein
MDTKGLLYIKEQLGLKVSLLYSSRRLDIYSLERLNPVAPGLGAIRHHTKWECDIRLNIGNQVKTSN